MASPKQLTGAEFVMVDGTALVTEVVTDPNRLSRCVRMILKDMIEHEDMVAGLCIPWINQSKYSDGDASLAICTRIGCVLVRYISDDDYYSRSLKPLFEHNDVTFAGVYMKEDVEKLRKSVSPLGIRNAVDLRELAADVLNQPRLRSVGVRRLGSEVLLLPFKPRSSRMAVVDQWKDPEFLNRDQIECVATDAYAAYKLGKQLLGF